MQRTNETSRSRLIPRLLLVVCVLLAAVGLAACGSSSSDSTASTSEGSGSETTTAEGSGGNPETTVYAKGVPTLAELYEGSDEEPPSSGPKAVPGKEVYVVSCGNQTPGCLTPTEETAEAARAIGWKAKIVDGKLNVNNGYSNAIRTAVAASPDAIILIGIGCAEAKSAIEEAKAANIAIVSFAGFDCSEEGEEKASEAVFTFPQTYNKGALTNTKFYEQYGEKQAAYIVDATEGRAKVILTGFPPRPTTTEGWEKVFAKCAECEILEDIEWEPAESAPGGTLYSRFETTLTKFPEANAAIFVYDSITIAGLAKAVVDSGRSSELTTVAGEGYPETLQMIEEEKGLDAEGAAYSSGWTGWGLVDNLNRYFSGEPQVPPGVGFTVITKDQNLPPKGQKYETKVDYKSAYESIWSGK